MILIISNNELDNETDLVCRWLIRKEANFLRLNMDDFLRHSCLVGMKDFVYNGKRYSYTDFSKIWVRRKLNRLPITFKDENFDTISNVDVNNFQQGEWEKFMHFFLSRFPHDRMINKAEGYFLSKIEQLDLAEKYELNPPASYFGNSLDLFGTEKSLIHKPAGNLGYLQGKDGVYAAFTEVIHPSLKIERLLPSFFQDMVNALYEIRVLFCNDQIFACGMIKSDEEENVDVKKQDSVRHSPVLIPIEYQNKIKAFMKSVGFKVGTLDVIKSKDDYHFIEMNPIGKFSFYSDVGSFGMERKIAELLMEEI